MSSNLFSMPSNLFSMPSNRAFTSEKLRTGLEGGGPDDPFLAKHETGRVVDKGLCIKFKENMERHYLARIQNL